MTQEQPQTPTTSDTSFSEENYKSVVPIFSSINSHIQTFLGVFASSMMALNAALITVTFSSKESSAYLEFGKIVFFGGISLYLFSFIFLFFLKRKLLNYIKQQNIHLEKIIHKFEESIELFLFFMIISSISLFISFLFLLKHITC